LYFAKGKLSQSTRAFCARALFSCDSRSISGRWENFEWSTLPGSTIYALRLFTIYVYAHVCYATTHIQDIGNWLTAVVRLLRSIDTHPAKKVGRCKEPRKSVETGNSEDPNRQRNHATHSFILYDPGILIMLVLLFFPRILDSFQETKEAAEIRGSGLVRNPCKRFQHWHKVLAQTIIQAIISAKNSDCNATTCLLAYTNTQICLCSYSTRRLFRNNAYLSPRCGKTYAWSAF